MIPKKSAKFAFISYSLKIRTARVETHINLQCGLPKVIRFVFSYILIIWKNSGELFDFYPKHKAPTVIICNKYSIRKFVRDLYNCSVHFHFQFWCSYSCFLQCQFKCCWLFLFVNAAVIRGVWKSLSNI